MWDQKKDRSACFSSPSTVRRAIFLTLLLAFSGTALLALSTPPPPCPAAGSCAVGTQISLGGSASVCGLAQTVAGQTAHAYLGIPFANAARWEHSQVTGPNWSGTKHATAFGAACSQPANTVNKNCSTGVCSVVQSESCLSLNVWTPAGATMASELPVMVYIYGGAFIAGESATALYDGARLAATQNVIVVSFNYRLGALGFLASSDGTVDGNFGFGDQQQALRWVQSYIGNFGGNKNNVTIFGESAGGMSVGLHALVAPKSKGMFKAAAMQSNPLGLPYKNRAKAGPYFDNLASHFSCTGSTSSKLECLKLQAPQLVVKAEIAPDVAKAPDGYLDILTWTPIVDGTMITDEPIHAIYEAKKMGTEVVPMLFGTNRNEGRIFADGIAAVAKTQSGHPFWGAVYSHVLKDLFPHHETVATKIAGSKVYGTVGYIGDATKNLDHFSRLLTDYLFTCANQYFAKTSPGPVYAYQFDQVPTSPFYLPLWKTSSQCKNEVCHGAELAYVFGSFDQNWCSDPNSETRALSNAMVSSWGAFASSAHDPGTAGGVTWPQYTTDSDYMLFANWTSTSTAKTGQPVTVTGADELDCSFLNTLIPGAEEWQNYQLFVPPGDDFAEFEDPRD